MNVIWPIAFLILRHLVHVTFFFNNIKLLSSNKFIIRIPNKYQLKEIARIQEIQQESSFNRQVTIFISVWNQLLHTSFKY
jgi:hypothetical protein